MVRTAHIGNVVNAGECSRNDSISRFLHLIYEFRKGVRSLVLCTMCRTDAQQLCDRLDRLGIGHLTQPVTENKVNLYFGDPSCLNAVRTFVHKPLNELTPEEDFMLGILLGYDLAGQCDRYCKRRSGGLAGGLIAPRSA